MKKITLLLALIPYLLLAQGTPADYARANYMATATPHKVYHEPSLTTWWDDAKTFWYRTETPSGPVFYVVDVEKRLKRRAFSTEQLGKKWHQLTGKAAEWHAWTEQKLDHQHFRFTDGNQRWEYHIAKDSLYSTGPTPPARTWGYWGTLRDETLGPPVQSPDKTWEAYIKNSNVYIRRSNDPKTERQMSFDGSPGEFYAAAMYWSPDSQYFVANRVRPGQKRTLTLIESSPSDQLQPKLHTRDYLKPGDALPQRQPVIFHAATGKATALDASLIANQYSLSAPGWYGDGFFLEYNQRGHQKYSILRVDAASGVARKVIKEESPTFIHYSGKRFLYYAAATDELIWMSERDGWNHLYLYDATQGVVKNQITQGNWVVRRVLHVDEAKRRILFEGSGKESGHDPYLIHVHTVNFDGTDLRCLTGENGNHRTTFSPDYRYFVDTWSRIDQAPETFLRSAEDGQVLMKLEKADITALLKTGWKLPEVFVSKGRDDSTDIWGMIIRPSNFDPSRKYPVIEYIYAGPHDSFVPKNFVIDSRGDLHQLAELGFIVVQIDGMGTSNRSKAFHDVCWQNLHDSGFPDRIRWIKAAAAKYPYMDIERVGIFGNSAGGQSSAGALLHYPEFYKVAVSSSGCHDNRMDKIWWNEQWMGFPVGPQYAASSNVTHAHQLQGKLMLILGELDDNVDPSSTYQLINALVKAEKNFEFVFIPGMGHSLGGDYGERRRRDFFVRHLHGVNPPDWHSP